MNKEVSRRGFFQATGAIALGAAGGAVGVSNADEHLKTDDAKRIISLSNYCAEDGVTDDGPNIQRAADDLIDRGGGELRFTPNKVYFWDTDVIISAAGVEVDVSMVDAKIKAGSSVGNILSVTGTRKELAGIAAYKPTNVGDTSITVHDAVRGKLSAGDWIMLWSSDVDNPERRTDYLSGEEAVVLSIRGTVVNIDRPLRLAHKRGADRRLFKFDLAIRPTITGGVFELAPGGSRQVALTTRYALRPKIEGVIASGKTGRYGIYVDQSIEPEISRVTGTDIYDSANGSAPNGAAICMNGVVGGTVKNSTGRRCRHALDVNSFSSKANPGLVSYDVVIDEIEAIDTFGPGWTTHHVRGVTFRRPTSINCGGGAQLRGYDTKLLKPKIIGGNTAKPDEWDRARYVPTGIAFGETNSLPQGKGFAARKVLITKPAFESLPDGWDEFTFSDDPDDVVIIR